MKGNMAIVNTYFTDFLSKIRLQPNHINDLKTGHKTLRDRLLSYDGLKDIIIATFLQGSYRRATTVRPHADKRADVDLIVVTNLSSDKITPTEAVKKFIPFLEEHYKGKYQINGRSIAIELSYVDLDLVITTAPSEAELNAYKAAEDNLITDDRMITEIDNLIYKASAEWRLSPLLIPDRDVHEWTRTHPLEQIRWTQEKNSRCSGHYVNVVKAIKWWHRIHSEELPKYPKSYPLEHLIGTNFPEMIDSVAEGVTFSLEAIVANYQETVARQEVPFLPDHGVPEHDVFKRISATDFSQFYSGIKEAAKIAREALDETDIEKSVNLWRNLLGTKFPEYSGGSSNKGGFVPPSNPTTPQRTQRFA